MLRPITLAFAFALSVGSAAAQGTGIGDFGAYQPINRLPGDSATMTKAEPKATGVSSAPVAGGSQCLLVKHKGTLGRRLEWFLLTGVPIAPGPKYDYIDAIGYTSSKFAYGRKDLAKIQASGVHIIVMKERFSAEDLRQARSACAVAK